jgi:hypothetical protein
MLEPGDFDDDRAHPHLPGERLDPEWLREIVL